MHLGADAGDEEDPGVDVQAGGEPGRRPELQGDHEKPETLCCRQGRPRRHEAAPAATAAARGLARADRAGAFGERPRQWFLGRLGAAALGARVLASGRTGTPEGGKGEVLDREGPQDDSKSRVVVPAEVASEPRDHYPRRGLNLNNQ